MASPHRLRTCRRMASSMSNPPTRRNLEWMTSPSAIIAISVVAPPTSRTMLPRASSIGSPAPTAAASGASTSETCLLPALAAAPLRSWRHHPGRSTGYERLLLPDRGAALQRFDAVPGRLERLRPMRRGHAHQDGHFADLEMSRPMQQGDRTQRPTVEQLRPDV